MDKLSDIFAMFKTSLGTDSLDPKIYKNAVIFEARSYFTHASKTWIIANVDPVKHVDFMSYVNTRYKQAQIGSMRTDIHLNHRVNNLAPNESLSVVFF
jgi:hypothetical protein